MSCNKAHFLRPEPECHRRDWGGEADGERWGGDYESLFVLLVIPFFHVCSQEFVTNAVLRKAG